ncbi:protein-disulfide reductase DsbD domain-containing protein [Aureimonas frigidaquae]|uniref:protein-disulfide reductase DsbD domain-containing protein n=1 Tax=Aureimonas frigidaquae TaxID=424757 RepID=UPI0007840E82|nr:protein-disulfide reductase DsbD domain-containing protein [Aureimonas frigidaquae]
MKFHPFAALLFALVCAPAHAAGGPNAAVATTPEVTLRLAVRKPDAQGRLEGAVVIDLAPGWKTYWLGPGEAGLPPRLDFSASRGLSAPPVISMPVPHRTDVGGVDSIVYTQPMAIAFTTAVAQPDAVLDLDLMIGVCQDVCIPVQAHLERDLSVPPGLSEAAAVSAAFDALPQETGAKAQARLVGEDLVLSLDLPANAGAAAAQLFVAAPAGWQFGPATAARQDGGHTILTAPVLARPQAAPKAIVADILVAAGEFARFFRAQTIDIGAGEP